MNLSTPYYLVVLLLLSAFAMNAQIAPRSVCTSPASYELDEEVTWYFDLEGNLVVTPGESLYFYSWEPQGLAGGRAQLIYEKDMIWSLTMIPTQLWGMNLADLEAAGNSAFWGHLENQGGTNVTGTLPFATKEQLRLGQQCMCMGTPSDASNVFLINTGQQPISGADVNGNTWTNVEENNGIYELNDTIGEHRYEVEFSGDFFRNNAGGLTGPQSGLLGHLAVEDASSSYMYVTGTGVGEITFSCLPEDREFEILILSSRSAADTRVTEFVVVGAASTNGQLQSSGSGISDDGQSNGNDDELFVVSVFPDTAGQISIEVTPGAGGFAYVNAVQIREIYDPVIIALQGLAIDTTGFNAKGPSQLDVTYSPANTTQQTVVWTVDDESIAIIDADGMLKPKQAGTVTVTVTSAFSGSIAASIDLTFENLVTELYLVGTATETLTNDPGDALMMRRVYDADSTITNLFEIYTSLVDTGVFRFVTAMTGGDSYSGSGGSLSMGNMGIDSPSGGWKHIIVDLKDWTYGVEDVNGWNVVSHMIATGQGQAGWWGGDEELSTYEGLGVWSANVNFTELTGANDSPRLYFTLIGGGRTLKYIDDSKNRIAFTDQGYGSCMGNCTLRDINSFQGEYKVTLDMSNYTYSLERECVNRDDNKITIMGSSVAKGYGAEASPTNPDLYRGYAYQYGEVLAQRFADGEGADWSLSNVSIGGNNTSDVTNRLQPHLFGDCGRYVVFGLSMANEGLFSGGEAIFDQFRDNLLALIDTALSEGIQPVVVGNYGNNSYNSTHYQFIKDINLLIHEWDVPSINVLGSLNDLDGRFVTGYYLDGGHPNTAGYTEFHHALVPSLFDALAQSKAQPVLASGTHMSLGTDTQQPVLGIIPEDEVHSFTTSFDFKTSNTGIIASLRSAGEKYLIKISIGGMISLETATGTISSSTVVNDDLWHKLTVVHYYAEGVTLLYLDGTEVGRQNEQFLLDAVTIADMEGASAFDAKDWFFYRSAMNDDEITALAQGRMLKSSLEVYAPLDGQAALGSDPLINLAQSLNAPFDYAVARVKKSNDQLLDIYPSPTSGQVSVSGLKDQIGSELSITSAAGQEVIRTVIDREEMMLDLSALPKGMYILLTEGMRTKLVKN